MSILSRFNLAIVNVEYSTCTLAGVHDDPTLAGVHDDPPPNPVQFSDLERQAYHGQIAQGSSRGERGEDDTQFLDRGQHSQSWGRPQRRGYQERSGG